jgi:hypothetical protein
MAVTPTGDASVATRLFKAPVAMTGGSHNYDREMSLVCFGAFLWLVVLCGSERIIVGIGRPFEQF